LLLCVGFKGQGPVKIEDFLRCPSRGRSGARADFGLLMIFSAEDERNITCFIVSVFCAMRFLLGTDMRVKRKRWCSADKISLRQDQGL